MATKALVIDDEEDYRIIIQEVLRGAGYEVRLAKDGEEGLALLKQAPADVVLVDWMMPRMDGERFCREMRAVPALKDTPVVMLTVKQTADEELEALHFGVDDFVKPFKTGLRRSACRPSTRAKPARVTRARRRWRFWPRQPPDRAAPRRKRPRRFPGLTARQTAGCSAPSVVLSVTAFRVLLKVSPTAACGRGLSPARARTPDVVLRN